MAKNKKQKDLDARAIAMANSCACYNVRRAARKVTQFYDEYLKESGLRTTQFTLLSAIWIYQPVTVGKLAKMALMDRTTLTRNLSPLQRQGLVKVEPGRDRRERVVSLTEVGAKNLMEAHHMWLEAQTSLVDRLGPERWNQIQGGLSDLLTAVRSG